MANETNTPHTNIDRGTALADLPEFLTVPEFCRVANVGRTAGYTFARQHGVRIGRLVRIPREKLAGR